MNPPPRWIYPINAKSSWSCACWQMPAWALCSPPTTQHMCCISPFTLCAWTTTSSLDQRTHCSPMTVCPRCTEYPFTPPWSTLIRAPGPWWRPTYFGSTYDSTHPGAHPTPRRYHRRPCPNQRRVRPGAAELAHYTGILVAGGCDQRLLATQQPQLDHWVESGGRVVANGHPIQRWLAKMPAHRALDFHTPEDLWLYPVGEHPIWRGVERTELIFRTGVP